MTRILDVLAALSWLATIAVVLYTCAVLLLIAALATAVVQTWRSQFRCWRSRRVRRELNLIREERLARERFWDDHGGPRAA